MTIERNPDRPGSNSAPLVMRFRLQETLQPGAAATAKILKYSQAATDLVELASANVGLSVHATFFRAFGAEGEDGWAMWHGDSQRWEVVSMEGSLLRHGTAAETIAENATGDVALYWNDGGSEASLGITVPARNIGSEVENGTKVQIWYEPHGEKWYVASGSGSGGAIVSVESSSFGETTCLLPGKVQSIEGTFTAACSSPFTPGEDCWLLVLNSDGGSMGFPKKPLNVGELYQGTLVTTLSGVSVYAIRDGGTSAAKAWHALAVDAVDAGDSGTFSRVDASEVVAENWTNDSDMAPYDKVVIIQDPIDGQYYAFMGGSSATVDVSTGVDIIIPGDTGDLELSTTVVVEVTNPTDLSIFANNSAISFMLDGERVVVPQGTHIFHLVCPTPGVDAGETISVTLPDGRPVDAVNWTGYKIVTEQKIFVGLDRSDGIWYIWPSTDPRVWNHFLTELQNPLLSSDANANVKPSIPSWKYTEVGEIPIAPYDVLNPLGLYGNAGDKCIVAELPGIADGAPTETRCRVTAVFNQHRIYHSTASDAIAAGEDGAVLLSTGEEVVATNWSDDSDIKAEAKILVYQDPANGKYYAQNPSGKPVQIKRFELLEALPLGGVSVANFVVYEAGEWVTTVEGGIVADFTGNSFRGSVGDRGWCIAMPDDNDQYEILWLRGEFIITECIAGGPIRVREVGEIAAMGDSLFAINIGADPIEVGNTALLIVDTYTNDQLVFRTGTPLLIRMQGSDFAQGPINSYCIGAIQGVEAASYSGSVAVSVQPPNATFTGLTLPNHVGNLEETPDTSYDIGSAQQLQIVHVVYAGETPPTLGDMWGPKPGDTRLYKGHPGYVAIGADSELYYGVNGAAHTATFEKQPVQLLLVKLTSQALNNDATQDYTIQCGSQGAEADGGWPDVPPAYNRSGRVLASDEMCVAIRLPSGWELVPLLAGSTALREYWGFLTANMLRSDSTGAVDGVLALDGGSDPGITTVTNLLDLAGLDNDRCLIGEDKSNPEETVYFFKNIMHHDCD